MNTWKVYVQIDAAWDFFYLIEEIPVTGEQYEQIQHAIRHSIPLRDCDLHRYLEEQAKEAAFAHLERYLIDLPDPEDYDTEAGYWDDIDNYEATLDAYKDGEFTIGSVHIYDPGDLQRLKDSFIGRNYPNCAWDDVVKTFHIIDAYRNTDNIVNVHTDKDGTVTDIEEIRVEDWEHEGLRDSDTYGCYPNYDLIEEVLPELLEQYRWAGYDGYECIEMPEVN